MIKLNQTIARFIGAGYHLIGSVLTDLNEATEKELVEAGFAHYVKEGETTESETKQDKKPKKTNEDKEAYQTKEALKDV